MGRILITDLRGGRNGADPPLSLPDNQAVEMVNVDHFDGLIGRKRGGCDPVGITGGTAFVTSILSLMRHLPSGDENAAELWGNDYSTPPIWKRLVGGTAWTDVTFDDTLSVAADGYAPYKVNGASFNGKLFLAYDTTVDRLHVYDPALAAPRVRRVGLATPAAPTAANTGVGAWAATKRYYRVRWARSSDVYTYLSEPSPSISFTPSGAGAATRITQPAVAGEGETYWRIEISDDDSTYYLGQTAAIGTTTIDDANPTTALYNLSDPVGAHALVPSAKYLLTDGNRLLMAGSWEASGATSGGKNARVWYTPVLGSLDWGDDERVINQAYQKNWVDLNENDGGAITGLGGPHNGTPYAFKYREIWRLVPTSDVVAPYLPRKLTSGSFGAINQKSIVMARDATGNPALYFLSPDGPCRVSINQYGASLPQYLGRDIEDLWATVNLDAAIQASHGIYFQRLHQIWWWVTTKSSNYGINLKLVFDVLLGKFLEGDRVRGGWSQHDGDSAAVKSAVMFATTLGATMSRDLSPYLSIGTLNLTPRMLKAETTATDDNGTAFKAYVKTKPLPVAPLGVNGAIGQTSLLAKAAAGVTITQTIDRDYGTETRTATVLLTAAGSETRVLKKIEGSDMAEAGTIQIQLGDSAAAANNWVLDGLSVPTTVLEPR